MNQIHTDTRARRVAFVMSARDARRRRRRTSPFSHRDLAAVITACACAWIAGKSGGHVRFQPYARLDALVDAHPPCAYATTRDTAGRSGMVFTRAYCARGVAGTEIRRCFVGARRATTRGGRTDADARTRRAEREMRRKARAMAAVANGRDGGEDIDEAYEAEVHAMRDWAIGEEMDGFAECGAADARADTRSGAREGERDIGVAVIETGRVTWRRRSGGDDEGDDGDGVRRKNTVDGTKGKLGTAVVVVTRDLRAFCFDGSLRELWRVDLLNGDEKRDRLKHSFRTVEVSVLISDVGARDDDAGLVVVGVRSERRAKDASTTKEEDDDDPLQRMTMGARRGRMPNFGRNGNEEWQTEADLDEDEDDGDFRYFAFEAETGQPRWNDAENDYDEHRKHEHGRLSLVNIDDDEIADASSKACSDFRESIVHDGLPHQWRGADDTRMRTAHFKRHKSRAMEMERAKKKRSRGNKTPSLPRVHTNGVTRALGRVVGRLQGSPTRAGVPMAHTAHRHVKQSEHPNVVLSHHSEGIDVLHLYSGARVCGMTLQSPGLHVDLDGDGVIDHVEAHDSQTRRASIPRCWATVHSGIDSSERVLSASICKGGSGLAGHRAAASAGHHDIQTVAVTPPVSLRRLPETANELSKPLDRMGRDAIFLNSRGEMTCYNMRDGGQRRWQVRTEANWVDDGVVTPSLTSFSMYVGGYLDIAIATGKSAIVAMNAKGYRAASLIEITTPPVRPLEVTDVDGDGLNDIVLHTQFSTYIWVQRPRLGNLPFTFLVGCLALTMAAAFIYQLADARENAFATGGKVRIVRSTMLDGDVDYSSNDDDDDDDDDDESASASD